MESHWMVIATHSS